MKEKFTEKISLKIKKLFMVSRIKAFLLMAILAIAFVTLNLWIQQIDLPKYDITENKLFSLSDESKKELDKLNPDVKVNIYVFGYEEDSKVVDLLKQYKNYKDIIDYQIITNETNADIIKKYGFESGNQALAFEVGDLNKVVYSSDFYTYDYSSYQQVDLTENTITNTILNLTIANKPKIYFVSGHNELSTDQYLTKILSYLENEVFDYTVINLLTVDKIPEDCDLLAIISPQKDLIESEVNVIQNYINNGGNIIYTSDLINPEEASLPNWQRILDLYGITIENGLIYETDQNSYAANSPLIVLPHMENHQITNDIITDGTLILEMPKRIITVDEQKQNELNVSYEELLKSSEKSFFLTDFSEHAIDSIAEQTPSESIIALKANKGVTVVKSENSENSTEGNTEDSSEDNTETIPSNIIVIASGMFISNVESSVASGYSQVDLYNNADFFANAVANLTNREDTVTIRKATSSSTYTPTEKQNLIVEIIIFVSPIVIIIIGIIVWGFRRHKR